MTTNLWKSARWVIGIWVATGLLGTIGQTIDRPSNPIVEFLDNLFDPSLLLAVGVGASALVAFYSILGAAKTFRAAIATSLTIVFFGLLLLPNDFSALTSEQFTDTFVWAWTVVIGFYFGTEGAVQAIKVTRGAGAPVVDGDAERITVEPPGQAPPTSSSGSVPDDE